MKRTLSARAARAVAALVPVLAVAGASIPLASCATSDTDEDAALPREEGPSPTEERIRDIQRERAAERPHMR